MELKFHLNKFVKLDNIENYTLESLLAARKCYDSFMEKTEGFDPDFPECDFSGGKKGTKIGGVNKAKVDEILGEETPDLGSMGGFDDSIEGLNSRKSSPGEGKMRDPNRGRKTNRNNR